MEISNLQIKRAAIKRVSKRQMIKRIRMERRMKAVGRETCGEEFMMP